MTDFSLEHPGGTIALDVHESTEGPAGIDISSLLKETDSVTYDPGFVNTASCRSDITFIDGDAGILRYRGYPIDQLAEKSTFLETSYLLIYGELPSQEQLEAFTKKISRHTLLHEDLKAFFNGFPRRSADSSSPGTSTSPPADRSGTRGSAGSPRPRRCR